MLKLDKEINRDRELLVQYRKLLNCDFFACVLTC